jgi:hypothetical protein
MAQSFLAGYPDKPVLVSKQVIENAEADVAVATANAEVAKKIADAEVASATTADQILEAKAKTEKAQLDLKKVRIELEKLKISGEPLTDGQAKAQGFYRRTFSSNQDLDRLNLDPDSTIGVIGYREFPFITSKVSSDERNSARSAVENFIAATLRLESGAVIGDDEFERQYRIFFPMPGAGPNEIEQKRRQRELAVKGFKVEAGPGARRAELDLAEQGYDVPDFAKKIVAPPQAEMSRDRVAGAGAETTTIEVPKEFQAALIEYVNTKGKDIDPKEFQTFFNNAAKTYGYSGRVSDEEAKRNADAIRGGARYGGAQPAERPLTPVERGVNEALLSTPGGVGTGLVNATTLGIPAMLNENIGRTVEGVREESPLATGVGDILGSAAMTAVGGAGLRAVGMPALKAEGLADILYSATTGATGAPEGERLSGAATNTVLATMGSTAPSVVKRVLKPNTDEDIKILRDAGVRLSPMQTVGGRADQVEEAASRLLLGGGDISIAARKRAFNDFGTAYLNKAGQYIGFQLPRDMKPQARIKAIAEAFDKQYDALRSQMTVMPDQDLLDDITNLKLKINDGVTFSPDNARRLQKLLDDQLVRRTKNQIGGDEYKSLSSLLKTRKRAFAKRGDQELADGVGDMEDILEAAARRHSPSDVVDMMNQTDRGFAILAQAQEAARMAGTSAGDFSPAQILRSMQTGDTRQRSRSFIEGEIEGQLLAQAGKNVLGNVLPSSGTTERLAHGLAVTGGGAFLSPATLLPNAAIGLINAPGVRDVLPKIFAGQRPKPIEAIGSGMEIFKTPLSLFGSATAQQFNPIEQTPEDYAATAVEPLPQPDIRYDPETKTYILPDGRRIFADGTPADAPEGMYRGGLMDLARKYR